ncbi:MAG: hypothetical protein EZS28_024181 [Streblomastix strix]|uniref:Uncharacterized protein n=1 Tax=Streblomastix strix TaxID=222440 RepID=A0A5J4VCQ7_9EUKA|nr:MAG: hypothetical protein EZS28_024181 [Streblomastix strix]
MYASIRLITLLDSVWYDDISACLVTSGEYKLVLHRHHSPQSRIVCEFVKIVPVHITVAINGSKRGIIQICSFLKMPKQIHRDGQHDGAPNLSNQFGNLKILGMCKILQR